MNFAGAALFAAGLIAFASLVVGLFLLRRKVVVSAERSLARCYDRLAASSEPQASNDVRLVFHTYHGFLVDFIQTEHAVFLPPDDARELLRRLNRFNLTWGLLCRGALFVYFLSPLNRIAQSRSIRRQETAHLPRASAP